VNLALRAADLFSRAEYLWTCWTSMGNGRRFCNTSWVSGANWQQIQLLAAKLQINLGALLFWQTPPAKKSEAVFQLIYEIKIVSVNSAKCSLKFHNKECMLFFFIWKYLPENIRVGFKRKTQPSLEHNFGSSAVTFGLALAFEEFKNKSCEDKSATCFISKRVPPYPIPCFVARTFRYFIFLYFYSNILLIFISLSWFVQSKTNAKWYQKILYISF
jgi:hypothetical protein